MLRKLSVSTVRIQPSSGVYSVYTPLRSDYTAVGKSASIRSKTKFISDHMLALTQSESCNLLVFGRERANNNICLNLPDS